MSSFRTFYPSLGRLYKRYRKKRENVWHLLQKEVECHVL